MAETRISILVVKTWLSTAEHYIFAPLKKIMCH